MIQSTTRSRQSILPKNTKLLRLSILFLLIVFSSLSYGQEDLGVLSYWKMHDQESHQLYKHLFEIADKQLEDRRVAVAKLKTAKDWEARRVAVKKKLQIMFGEFPERTPLNPVVTGIIERDGIRVEKLYFESRPGYYVTAALFLPLNRQKKLPAIVYCSGHSESGFRAEAYQRIILNYTKKGFAVLAFDPVGQGERKQYLDKDGKSRFGPTSDHSYSGSPSFISGIAPANYFIWDGIRAIDYLTSREEVDASRIGIAGRSGGGTQSTFIAALDSRVVAAAPECYVTSFDKLLRSKGPQDAEQNPLYTLGLGIDMADLLEVRAPNPTLLVTTTEDIFSIQGARDVYTEVRRAYLAQGKKGNIVKVEDSGGHVSTRKNRESSYAFFQQFLVNPGDSTDQEVVFFKENELFATSTGNVYSSLNGETLFSLNRIYIANLIKRRSDKSAGRPVPFQDFKNRIAEITGYKDPGSPVEIIFSGTVRRAGYTIEKYLIERAGGVLIPILWMKPETGTDKVMLIVSEHGKKAEAKIGGDAEKLVLEGYDVVIPDLSGFGELANSYIKGGDAVLEGVPLNLGYMGILVNKSLVAVHAEELKLVSEFIKTKRPADSLSAIGVGALTTDVLHAAVLLRAFDKIALVNPLISYQSITEQENYLPKFMLSAVAGALPYYDLSYLVAMLSPKPVFLLGTLNASGELADKNHVASVYGQSSSVNGLKIDELQPGANYFDSLKKWLKE